MEQKIENFVQCEKFNEFEMEHAFLINSNIEGIKIPTNGTSQRVSINNRKMYKVRYKLVGVVEDGPDRIYVTYIFERIFDKK
jgi:hypothetical protein